MTAAAPVAAPPPDDDAAASAYPYPRQSLVDLFKGASGTASPTPNVPRPPSTYTPSAQPYDPSQLSGGAPAGSPPPSAQAYDPSRMNGGTPAAAPASSSANTEEIQVGPYPTQSLVDLFSNKSAPK